MSQPDAAQGEPRPVFGVPAGELVRDAQVAALLALLAFVLLPAWVQSGGLGTVKETQVRVKDPHTGETIVKPGPPRMVYGADLLKSAMTPWLLPALGLLWVLGAGGIDLSVWVVFSLGAAVAARVTGAGASPVAMLAAVAGVGLAVGALHASGVYWLRLPSWGVTLVTAIVGVSVVAALTGGEPKMLSLSSEFDWPGADRPMTLTGWFFVIALLSGLFLGHGRRPGQAEGAGVMAASLATSAVLSALGGMCWLIRNGWTPAPGHLLGDLRVAAAAVLAGAAILRTHSGRLIAGLLLLPAMLLATAWRQCVRMPPVWPLEWNPLLLAGMVLGVQWAWACGQRTRRVADRLVGIASVDGLLLVAGSAWPVAATVRAILLWAGLAIWALAMLAAGVRRRKAVPPPMPEVAAP